MNTEITQDTHDTNLAYAVDIVSSYVKHHPISAQQIGHFLKEIYETVSHIKRHRSVNIEKPSEPAVPIEESINEDGIICLEDGKKLKLLKRYLRVHYKMSPDEYRRRWGLPANYPMVAPNYSKRRSSLARSNDLGRRRRRDFSSTEKVS